MKLDRRLKKLESRQFDPTGLVPHSDAWFAFHERTFDRFEAGEDIGDAVVPLEVIDRIVEAADRETAAR
jgi:hypothetical protein